jgi:hypothetical protein
MQDDDSRGEALRLLRQINHKVGVIMTAQADIDNAVSVLLEVTQGLTTLVGELQADLAGQNVDTSRLDASLAPLQSAEAALQALADSVPPATSGTGTTTTPGTTTTGTTTSTGTTP